MYINSGYYDSTVVEDIRSDIDFFVHCSGHYRLINRKQFYTDRKSGTPHHHLLYIADGTPRFLIQDSLRTVTKGHCVLYRPLEPQYYEYQLSDHADIYWIHFSCKEEDPFLKHIGMESGTVYKVGKHADYTRLFDRIIQELQMKKEFFSESNTLRLRELLIMMARNRSRTTEEEDYTYYPQVEAAIRRFHQCPEANFTIKEYVRQNNLNYYRFIDSFTRITGTAPRQYIINIRMSKAKSLLSNDTFSIGDVSRLVGYENALYFSRLFHKNVGVPPSEYRRQMRYHNLVF